MLSIFAVLALLPTSQPSADEYKFVPDSNRRVRFYRRVDGLLYEAFGKLDTAGNFVPDSWGWHKQGPFYSGLQPDSVNARFAGSARYEYRSGALIPGRFDDTMNFVPEVGRPVIDFQDYLKNFHGGMDALVWNLPGTLVKKAARPARGQAPPAAGRDMPAPGAPAPAERVPPGEYQFVTGTDRWVEVRRREDGKEFWSLGKLDAAGNFIPDKDHQNRTGPKPAGTPEAVLLNREGVGACYEYRSGTLVKGRIDEKLNFVPEVGSRVIDFGAYHYGPESRFDRPPLPIWNLPGSFQKRR